MSFKDHFSKQSKTYATFRPVYPKALFKYLASLTEQHQLAWDCATGNGQAAGDLVPYFEKIIATDASAGQIANAKPHPKITYEVCAAEDSKIISHSVDLIAVAQAAHWFNLEKFYMEVNRVLKKEGILAMWCYAENQIAPAIDCIVKNYTENIVGPCWPPERKIVDEHFTTIPFPFAEIQTQKFKIEAEWNLAGLLGYLESWSATQKYIEKNKINPLDLIRKKLTQAWGNSNEKRKITWPIYLRAGSRLLDSKSGERHSELESGKAK